MKWNECSLPWFAQLFEYTAWFLSGRWVSLSMFQVINHAWILFSMTLIGVTRVQIDDHSKAKAKELIIQTVWIDVLIHTWRGNYVWNPDTLPVILWHDSHESPHHKDHLIFSLIVLLLASNIRNIEPVLCIYLSFSISRGVPLDSPQHFPTATQYTGSELYLQDHPHGNSCHIYLQINLNQSWPQHFHFITTAIYIQDVWNIHQSSSGKVREIVWRGNWRGIPLLFTWNIPLQTTL